MLFEGFEQEGAVKIQGLYTSMIPAVLQRFGLLHQQLSNTQGGSAGFWVLLKMALQNEEAQI